MSIDPLRHLEVFSPADFKDRRIDIIGCGAVGSRIALSLAKLGVENIHVWDFDKVEEHNIANQAFGNGDIGELKAEALARIVKEQTGVELNVHVEEVTGNTVLGDIVYLLTDTMKSRKEIFEGAMKFKLRTKLLIETRMGADSGYIYTLDPNMPAHIKAWEGTLYSDDEAEVSACGSTTSVGPTAETISGLAVWQMIRWFNIEQGKEDTLDNEILMSLRPMMTVSRTF